MTELSPETKKLFDAAREAYSPSAQRVDALQGALQARIAADAASGGAAATGGAATTALAVKAAIVLGVATAVVVGVSLLRGSEPAPAPSAPGSARPAAAATEIAAPQAHEPVSVAPASVAPTVVAPTVVAPRAAKVEPPAERRAQSAPRSAAPRRAAPVVAKDQDTAVSSAPQRPARVGPASAVGQAAPVEPTHPEPQAAIKAPEPAPEPEDEAEPVAPPVVSRDALDAEIRLLRAARAALDNGAAERALSILDAHAERYPRGTLTQEQLATRTLALCALDRTAAARVALRELSRLSPSSPHLSRLRTSCAWPATR